jgi:triacylglycerol lipase
MAKALAFEGYCVYSLTYGLNTKLKFPTPIGGLTRMEDSAAELSLYIGNVLNVTRASKVDIIGHSEGGLMPRYYLKYLNGAPKVNLFYGIAPVGQGTELYGISKLQSEEQLVAPVRNFCEACPQLLKQSPFILNVNEGGDTVPGVRYVTLITKYDEAVIPPEQGYLTGNNVQNYRLQDFCPFDISFHMPIITSVNALELVLRELDPARKNKRFVCRLF